MTLRNETAPLAMTRENEGLSLAHHLRANWPEYLIEAWALGMFMVSACLFTIAFEYPDSRLHQAIGNADLRRALIGIAMGLTAVALIYSPWGKRSGAHMNPAVTLTFAALGKISPLNAMFYILFQCVGGVLGVLLVASVCGQQIAHPAVNYALTMPSEHGVGVAFLAEFIISFLLMSMVLYASNSARLQNYTGVLAGILVATFIVFEAPLSGMSMNPARSLASALPANNWSSFWIYLVAPVVAMQFAGIVHVVFRSGAGGCAKLVHTNDQRCIHCGYATR